MTGRIDADGRVTLEGILPEDLAVLMSALQGEFTARGRHAARCELDARMRREMAAAHRRGRHANERIAGELDAEGRDHTKRQLAALDLIRVLKPLVSETEARAASQLESANQTEEG